MRGRYICRSPRLDFYAILYRTTDKVSFIVEDWILNLDVFTCEFRKTCKNSSF